MLSVTEKNDEKSWWVFFSVLTLTIILGLATSPLIIFAVFLGSALAFTLTPIINIKYLHHRSVQSFISTVLFFIVITLSVCGSYLAVTIVKPEIDTFRQLVVTPDFVALINPLFSSRFVSTFLLGGIRMGSELLLVVVLFAAVAGAVFSRKMYFKRLIAAPLRFWLLLHIFKFLVVGMAMSLLCDLLDVPVPKAIGVICAFCEWVPFLGVFVALASLVLLLKDAAIGIIIGIISSYLIFKVFLYLFGVYISEHTALRVKSLKLIISMVMLSVWFGPVGLLLAGPICHLSRGIFLNARINENKVETSMKAA